MILSTQTELIFRTFGEEKGAEIFAQAGFDAIDYSMFYMSHDEHPVNTCDLEDFAKKLLGYVRNAGISFNQAHAPFPGYQIGNDAYNAKMPGRVERSVQLAGMLGAKTIVVHPIAFPGKKTPPLIPDPEHAKRQMEFNLEMYRHLAEIARPYGVRIALENMWGYDGLRSRIVSNVCSDAEELAAYYDALNQPEAFTVCLDLGHCGLVSDDAARSVRVLGHDRLGALHVHDNNAVSDSHTVPYTVGCNMNWEEIPKALGEIDYAGDFTFEADNFLVRFDRELLPAASAFMAQIGRTLVKKVDLARPEKK